MTIRETALLLRRQSLCHDDQEGNVVVDKLGDRVKKIVECVPNFSEGRRRRLSTGIANALASVPGVALLDAEMTPPTIDCVITIAGEPGAVAAGVVAGVAEAVRLIDLRHHQGEHPRMACGRCDPFTSPFSVFRWQECVELSVQVAKEIAARCGIPSTSTNSRARRSPQRLGQRPQKGSSKGSAIRYPAILPQAGLRSQRRFIPPLEATAVGARFPLVAYNVYLQSNDLKIAQAVARAVRFFHWWPSSRKGARVRNKERSQVQVS